MKNTFLIFSVALASFLPFADAGQVFMTVSVTKDRKCLRPAQPEMTQYLLSPDEAITALDNYFKAVGNPELYDAAIVNAGLRFCGEAERTQVFSHIVHSFDQPSVEKRVFEVAANYYGQPAMKRVLKETRENPATSPELKSQVQGFENWVMKKPKAKPKK